MRVHVYGYVYLGVHVYVLIWVWMVCMCVSIYVWIYVVDMFLHLCCNCISRAAMWWDVSVKPISKKVIKSRVVQGRNVLHSCHWYMVPSGHADFAYAPPQYTVKRPPVLNGEITPVFNRKWRFTRKMPTNVPPSDITAMISLHIPTKLTTFQPGCCWLFIKMTRLS